MYNYKRIRIAKDATRDEHRLVIEKQLGRKLLSTEVVHHIDGNKLNNAIENLEVMSRTAHTSMHSAELWANPEYRERVTASIKAAAKKWDGVYRPTCLQKHLQQLALESWPIHTGSLRQFAAHYGIHHKQMGRILRERLG